MSATVTGTAMAPTCPLPRVLLVDDEQAILDGLRRQLRRHFDVSTALGGAHALEVLATAEPFAVVLSDMRMPGMDGATLLAIVRDRYPETVRLLLTGQADMDSTISAINDGQVFRFLAKPCPAATIHAALLEASDLHRQTSVERDVLRTVKRAAHALDSCERVIGGGTQAPRDPEGGSA